MSESPIPVILARLQSLSYSDNIYVVGSVARGSNKPKDLDVVVVVPESYTGPEQLQNFSELLRLSHRYYGWFDPFLDFGNKLLVRNESASGWTVAKGGQKLRASFRRDMKPLREISPKLNEAFNIRAYLDLVESLNKNPIPDRLYHGSRRKLPAGTILTPQVEGYTQEDDPDIQKTEAIMEKYRPRDAIPRRESVFMVAHPEDIDYAGGYDDHVYLVRPIGQIEVNDLHWYSQVAIYYPHDEFDDEVLSWINNYWNGTPGPAEKSLPEFRARKAEILQEIDS